MTGRQVKELRILSAGAAQGLIESLAPQFLALAGVALRPTFGAVGAIREKLLGGEQCDALILTHAMIDQLATAGLVVAGTQGALGAGAPTGSPNLGGAATTETGLVFIGATLDAYFRAFDTRDGREVWKARLPTSARATPLLFTTASGRHMVAIAAGGHDHPLSKIDTKLVVFALKK